MKISREKKKKEAIKRMESLRLYPGMLQQFKDEDLVSICEPPNGAFYWLDDESRKIVEEFEKKYNALVFTAIRNFTEMGILDSYLFINDYLESWETERKELKEGMALAYVYNKKYPEFSEMGTIGFKKTIASGLRRIW